MLKKELLFLALLSILATIPLFFGARHPLIQGAYSAFLLAGYGFWTVRNHKQVRTDLLNRQTVLASVLLGYLFITTIPLPLFLIRFLSPVRADYIFTAAKTLTIEPLATLSYYAPDTRFSAIYLFALLLYFFYTTIILRKDGHVTAILWVITSVGLFEAAYGLLQAMNPALGVLWLPSLVGAEGCARGTIIYRNQFAALLNMCWPMALVLAIRLSRREGADPPPGKKQKGASFAQRLSRGFNKSMLPLLGSAFMILAVIFSRSRGGIVVLTLLFLLLLVLLPFSKRIKGWTGSAFALFIMIYGGMIGFHQVAERFLFFYESALARLKLWLDSLAMLQDHLVTGIGMGAYHLLSPVYLRKVPTSVWYDFAHNEYVELAIELGLPMLILFLVWLIMGMSDYGRLVVRAARHARGLKDIPDSNVLAIGSFCGLLGFLLHGFVDFVWRLPVNSFYAVTILALLSAAVAPVPTDE